MREYYEANYRPAVLDLARFELLYVIRTPVKLKDVDPQSLFVSQSVVDDADDRQVHVPLESELRMKLPSHPSEGDFMVQAVRVGYGVGNPKLVRLLTPFEYSEGSSRRTTYSERLSMLSDSYVYPVVETE